MVTLLGASCNTTKFLGEDEYLLTKNTIKFKGKVKPENKRSLKYELSTLYRQKPNTNLFFIPREWFYFKTQDPNDTTRLDNWQRRVLAEPPSIYDPTLTQETAQDMLFLLADRGYYDARVDTTRLFKNKKAKVSYFIYPKKPYRVDSVFFNSADQRIDSILQTSADQSLLKKGEKLDIRLLRKERKRLLSLLRNQGYAAFFENFFPPRIEVDTFDRNYLANIYLEVLPPARDSNHMVYYIGEINVYPEYNAREDSVNWVRDTVNGIIFHQRSAEPLVKPEVLARSIRLVPGTKFSQEDYDQTNRILGRLPFYRFVRIDERIDSLKPNTLHMDIRLTPNPKLEVGVDFDLNYTNRNSPSVPNNLIGVSVSPSYRDRNFLGGAETLVSNLRLGAEINPSFGGDTTATFWNTVDIGLNTNLYFPRFRDYLGIWKGVEKLPFSQSKKERGEGFYDLLMNGGNSRVTVGYNFLSLVNFYRYTLLNFAYGFDAQKALRHRYSVDHLVIDYFSPETEPAFDEILESNPFLERSFGQQLFVSLLFRGFNYQYSSLSNNLGESHFWGVNIETAGTEIWLGNTIYNAFALNSDTLRIGDTDFSQYVKLGGEFRYYRQYTPKTAIASRLSMGIARPFGYSREVPYVKQYFVGGPNSIRAWLARGLGPGGFFDTLTVEDQNLGRLYQSGDFRLEFNLEYRFNIFWRLNGALFLDAGNVWTIRDDPSRPGSQFLFSERTDQTEYVNGRYDPFWKQIALGSGFGLRFDFTYFILRADLGVRLRYPYPQFEGVFDNGGEYWVPRESYFKGNNINLNFGLGFPF